MSPSSDHNKLGQTKRESAESKAETTKRISQEIQQAETERRQAKTEKLKLARLALQAQAPTPEKTGGKNGGAKKRLKARS